MTDRGNDAFLSAADAAYQGRDAFDSDAIEITFPFTWAYMLNGICLTSMDAYAEIVGNAAGTFEVHAIVVEGTKFGPEVGRQEPATFRLQPDPLSPRHAESNVLFRNGERFLQTEYRPEIREAIIEQILEGEGFDGIEYEPSD